MENTQEKSLIKKENKKLFVKLLNFMKKIFNKNVKTTEKYNNTENINEIDQRSNFLKSIKNIDDEQSKLLKLQNEYRNGTITEKDLSDEQIDQLLDLFDTQIMELKKSNEQRKKKLMKYNS